LCFAFVQMTRTTPRRRTILHLSQIFLTDALTFITVDLRLPDNPAASQIPRHQFHDHAIPDQHSNEIAFGAAATDVSGDAVTTVDLHFVQPARQL